MKAAMLDSDRLRSSALSVMADVLSEKVVAGCEPDGVVLMGDQGSGASIRIARDFIADHKMLSSLPLVAVGVRPGDVPRDVYLAAGHGASEADKLRAILRCMKESRLGRNPVLVTPVASARWHAASLARLAAEMKFAGVTVQAVHAHGEPLGQAYLLAHREEIVQSVANMLVAVSNQVLPPDADFLPGGKARVAWDLYRSALQS